MTPATTSEPTKRRSGWRMLGMIVLGIMLLTIGGGFWWYYDRSDLERVTQHAKDLGRPTTWKAMASPMADDKRILIWNDIIKLQASLGSYEDSKSARSNSKSFNIWDTIPQALLDHHAALSSEKIAELGRLLDELGDEPLILHDEFTYRTLLPEIGAQRNLIRFMQERLLIADQAGSARWGRRMLASCRSFNGNSLILHMVRVSCISIALSGIARRLPDLKSGHPDITQDILATTKDLHGELLRSLDGEYLLMFDALSRNIANNGDGVATTDWFMPLVVRAGRGPALIAHLDDLNEFRSLDPMSAMAWGARKDADFQAAKSGRITPELILRGLFAPVWEAIAVMSIRTDLHARLIVAELRGAPWPIDEFDPHKAPLRPLFQDGRIIAGYSVDQDGVDQGATDKRDRVFPLYAKPPQNSTPVLRSSADP